jgi:hypothetical protein
LDLDPNNIEKINVLKGFAAATLTEQQVKNGVILQQAGSNKTTRKQKYLLINLYLSMK